MPLGSRFLAVSPQVATFILTELGEKLARLEAGSAGPSALRDAVIGSLYGFTILESSALDPGTALAYHSSAFLWTSKAPAIPKGAPNAAAIASQGVAMRQLFGFDSSTLSDASIVSTFAGAALVIEDESDAEPVRVVKLATDES